MKLNLLRYAAFCDLVKDAFNEFILKDKNQRIKKIIIKEVRTGVRIICIIEKDYKILAIKWYLNLL